MPPLNLYHDTNIFGRATVNKKLVSPAKKSNCCQSLVFAVRKRGTTKQFIMSGTRRPSLRLAPHA